MKFRLTSTSYILLVAVFFAAIQNIALWKHLSELFAENATNNGVFIATIPLFIIAALNIIFNLLLWPWLQRPLVAILIFISSLVTYAMYSYGVYFDYGMIVNVFETNPAEAGSYFSIAGVVWIVAIAIIPIAILWRIKVVYRSAIKEIIARCISILISVLVIVVIAAGYYKDYASLVRNHSEIKALINPTNYITATFRYAKYQLIEAKMPFTQLGVDAKDSHQSGKHNVVVMVVGEASRSMNYSLNGYDRDTNPELAKRNVISFLNVKSCGTATAVSLPCMFSVMTKTNYNAIDARHQDTAVDILQRAGIDVSWKDNDSGCKGVCDRVKHIVINADSDPKLCHDGTCYDEVLLKNLQAQIDDAKQDTLIVLHIIGSHGPTYNDRYPAKFKVFKPTCNTSNLQECSREQVTNTYDNTILYTDHILSSVIDMLKSDDHNANTAMIYMADHGESLGEDGVYLHGLPYSIAPKEQTTVPLILWLSPAYQQSQHINRQCLQREAAAGGYSQDNLFHTLLGMMDVKTKVYDPKLDIFSQCQQ
ncbi:phosphoethanolamine transferase EptA [Photobacterium aquimaris]|uniref:Phosphoethanolamine transferase EptA n=1 Tax=Photobacterium aquimaris TaxID=512643 RepID=A0A2T3I3C7_9GAMM|nr:phosphoethanolamine transferase EptA [Photobacterium aquimaris]MCP4954723.1 phosphoethanolamine transferase EptA [Photobacterium aquimaris]OBU22096.1 phosphoethanolamine transferase EptA [Photobacterium aquimaris]PQJ38295.1 phosphoethanolamine transferase EptA [Photobacterium aquimaris]PSU12932.1 phosphoethanolamine transferase EptA [Photobacterium aquimaris]